MSAPLVDAYENYNALQEQFVANGNNDPAVHWSAAIETTLMPATDSWTLRSSMSTIKFIDGFFSYGHSLSWVIQTDFTGSMQAGSYVTSWFSPKWAN
jgi:hypothetical protein